MTFEYPERFPPPHPQAVRGEDGLMHLVMEHPAFECGQKVQLAGKWVVCTRAKNHPVFLDWGHSNGYVQWAFDTPESP